MFDRGAESMPGEDELFERRIETHDAKFSQPLVAPAVALVLSATRNY